MAVSPSRDDEKNEVSNSANNITAHDDLYKTYQTFLLQSKIIVVIYSTSGQEISFNVE